MSTKKQTLPQIPKMGLTADNDVEINILAKYELKSNGQTVVLSFVEDDEDYQIKVVDMDGNECFIDQEFIEPICKCLLEMRMGDKK